MCRQTTIIIPILDTGSSKANQWCSRSLPAGAGGDERQAIIDSPHHQPVSIQNPGEAQVVMQARALHGLCNTPSEQGLVCRLYRVQGAADIYIVSFINQKSTGTTPDNGEADSR